MKRVLKYRPDIAVRLIADTGVFTFSTALALLLQFFVLDPHTAVPKAALIKHFLDTSALLVPLGLLTLFLMGAYTYMRGYALLQKAWRVFQAVTLVYLMAGFAHYVLHLEFLLPRKALVMGWMFAAFAAVFVRLCANLWALRLLQDHGLPISLPFSPRERNVLLIGGAGYIGSALVPLLLESGYHVRLFDSFVYGEEPIAPWLGHRNLEVVRADFRQIDRIVEAMQGVGTVIHLGAIVGDPACALNEDLTIEVNLVATRMIAEVAKGEGASRFIFASTCSVYGISDELLNENSRLNPVSLYARSKTACEQVLLGFASESFQPVILRFGTIYGLSGRTRFDLVVNLLAAKAVTDGEMTVFGSDQWRPFVHVQDAARAVLAACQARSQNLRDFIFNVGSDSQNLTLGDVGRLISEQVPSARLKFVEENVDRRNYRVSFQRIRKELRFAPNWSVEDGIAQVIEAVRSKRVLDYRDPAYSNVKYLSDEGREVLKVQNGWARDLIECAWTRENGEAPCPVMVSVPDNDSSVMEPRQPSFASGAD